MYPMCYAQVATQMTKERTAQLRKMPDDNDPRDTSASSDQSDEGLATEHLIRKAVKQLAEVRLDVRLYSARTPDGWRNLVYTQ